MFKRTLLKVYNSQFLIRSKSEMFRIRLQDLIGVTRRGHFGIYLKLLNYLNQQQRMWKRSYSRGYFYQGLEELGINGSKPTGYRFQQYEVDSLLRNSEILDIGSNNGFVSIYCARLGKNVTGIEYNPYLINIAREVSTYLDVFNTYFIQDDFTQTELSKRFDVVLSLSNHHTIDGGLNVGFEDYLIKIVRLLKPNGYLLFESHNVFGPGKGGVGDDGDMEDKILIITKYFEILRFRMIRRFLKHNDVDKLFVIARQSNKANRILFNLSEVRNNYQWTYPAAKS